MLQRIQSVFLAAVSIAMAICVGSPIWQKTDSNGNESINLDAFAIEHIQASQTHITNHWYIAVLAIVACILAIYSIFQYRNRMRQIVVNAINGLVMIGVLGSILYLSMQNNKLFDPTNMGKYDIGFFAVMLALVFNMLANRFIRRDENLVRSADRMR